uniref:ATP-dependent RNA helicase n=1 Tax=Spongospora subterranea TaxID=70186 RepID=A0A0H5R9D3_9EUKA|eukprot:CRZ10735.1 hypothetical protein [Spongospora subterranea]
MQVHEPANKAQNRRHRYRSRKTGVGKKRDANAAPEPASRADKMEMEQPADQVAAGISDNMQMDAPSTGTHMSNVRFADLPLSAASQDAISNMGFRNLTNVQAATLPHIMKGKDVLAKAKTGTGKTVAFLLPSIEKIRASMPSKSSTISILILSPTRELAAQIANEAKSLIRFHGFRVELVVGGTNMTSEAQRLRASGGVELLVATPGRLLDHLKNTNGFSLQLCGIQILVLDEADQLLERGFQPDIVRILGFLPAKEYRQTLLFSATVPASLHDIVHLALRDDHQFIDTVGDADEQTNSQVEQFSAIVSLDQQFSVLEALIRDHISICSEYKIIVFFPTARGVGYFALLFSSLGLSILEMHSRKSQAQRTKISNQFRENSNVIMFTSDVSARGVDYPDVSLIIQVGLTTKEQYIHRVGRTGRAGREGKSILLLAPFERKLLSQMQDLPIQDISQNPLISSKLQSKQLLKALSSVDKTAVLQKAAQQAYQAFLGFYNSNLRMVNWSKSDLVRVANDYAKIMGLSDVPALQKKTVGMMGLRGVQGLRVE